MTDDLLAWLARQLENQRNTAQILKALAAAMPAPETAEWLTEIAGTLAADVDAKRRILDLHDRDHECSVYDGRGEVDNCAWVLKGEACSTIRLLALSHAGKPGYREEWKP